MAKKNIIVYSTHCPHCKTLEQALENKQIKFTVVDDVDKVLQKAKEQKILTVPFMQVGGEPKLLTFTEAMKYIKEEF